MNRNRHNLSVLDLNGEETDQTVPVHIGTFSDVLLIELSGVNIYIEKQGEIVGVYVGSGDDGRADALMSLRLERFPSGQANLRYDRNRVVLQSDRGA